MEWFLSALKCQEAFSEVRVHPLKSSHIFYDVSVQKCSPLRAFHATVCKKLVVHFISLSSSASSFSAISCTSKCKVFQKPVALIYIWTMTDNFPHIQKEIINVHDYSHKKKQKPDLNLPKIVFQIICWVASALLCSLLCCIKMRTLQPEYQPRARLWSVGLFFPTFTALMQL